MFNYFELSSVLQFIFFLESLYVGLGSKAGEESGTEWNSKVHEGISSEVQVLVNGSFVFSVWENFVAIVVLVPKEELES